MNNDFFYGISHDLASLVGSSKVFIKDLDNPESLTMLEANIEKLDKISKGITKISRMNSEKKTASIDIKESIKYVASKLKNVGVFKINICNSYEIKKIETMPLLLEEALFQVLHNAIVFCKKKIEINVNFKKEEKNLSIEIIDSCNKIPEDKLEHVFSPFRILEKREDYNCGLGLYIAKTAIENLSGSIYFERAIEVCGNKLVISLPVKEV